MGASTQHEEMFALERSTDPTNWLATQFVRFAQVLFRAGGGSKAASGYEWSEDDVKSDLLITDQIPLPQETIEKQPAIQLVLGGEQNQTLGIGYLADLDFSTGERTHIDLIGGSATFNIHTRTADTAKRLARYIQSGILRHQRELIRLARLQHIGMQVQMGPVSAPGALVQAGSRCVSVMVSVLFQYFYTERWTSKPGMVPWGLSQPDTAAAPAEGVSLQPKPIVKATYIDYRVLNSGRISRAVTQLQNAYRLDSTPMSEQGRAELIVEREAALAEAQQETTIAQKAKTAARPKPRPFG